ncbi:hypothetical protein [Branchiibius sp. NY16-3462-2]|uniref:hypothetical protein n=1 Tax=Branchiibius sp. NY16-3462-2 TaxID=1807500 RepID=UPI0025B830C0|nr:hypothetical protein [Branchiibius sp. NY16-3462-2]
MSEARPTPIPAETTGLSLGYRFVWRLQYTLLAWGGPAQMPLHRDPRERMRRERTARVRAALPSEIQPD